MSDEIRDEDLAAMLRERGYTVTEPEPDEPDLNDRLDTMAKRLEEMSAEPPSPEEAEARFAEEHQRRGRTASTTTGTAR